MLAALLAVKSIMAALAPAFIVLLGGMFLLKRKQLDNAKIEVDIAKSDAKNEAAKQTIASDEAKVESDDKDRLAKNAALRDLADKPSDSGR